MAKKGNGKGKSKGRAAIEVTTRAYYAPDVADPEQGRRRKTWSIHDLRAIRAATARQQDAIDHWRSGQSLVLDGAAGTGKTLLALYLAFSSALTEGLDGVTIIRSAVQTRDLGALKGSLEDKLAPYSALYADTVAFLFGRKNTYRDMVEVGALDFESTSFLRGKTFADRVVVVDEAQNMTYHEIETVVTRMGENARLIFIADPAQNDLKDLRQDSGYERAKNRFMNMASVSRVHFLPEDNVRRGLSREWLLAPESAPSHLKCA